MKKILIFLLATEFSQVFALPEIKQAYTLPETDISQEVAKASQYTGKDQPFVFAAQTEISDLYVSGDKGLGGQWDQIDNDTWVWRLKVQSKNAKSLGFGFYDFYLPPTATLSFYNKSGVLVKGPFDEKKNKDHKQFWPGPIIGDTVTVELTVDDEYRDQVNFSIDKIARGFRAIWEQPDFLKKSNTNKFWETEDYNVKSGSCNVDVVCSEGDEWRDQIRSVARYVINGSGLCTGQLVNNTNNDGDPLFLTANHCGFNAQNAASINIWWNYESPTCRTPNSISSGTAIPTSGFNDTQSGATFLASSSASDFSLLRLDEQPDPSYNVFYSGWDRTNNVPTSATGIHHPSGHAKRISHDFDSTIISDYEPSPSGDTSTHIKVVDWDVGTTEGGSSGSGLWNQNKLLVGQLHGGWAACGNDDSDYYGRLYRSWTGGGTPSTRLKDWLDPGNTGAQTLQGLGACPTMTASISRTFAESVVGVEQEYTASVSGGEAPYSYSWDVNGDEVSDGSNSSIVVTHAQPFIGDVVVNITDANGCPVAASMNAHIVAPNHTLLETGNKVQMCGNGDSKIDPGERWKVPVTIASNGFSLDAENVYAVFKKSAPDIGFEVVDNDIYGNQIGACDRQFIDISSSGTSLTFVPVTSNYSANDEGVASVNLTQSFNLYGNTISSLYLSSNGYISIDSSESGFDFSNDCPIPALPSNISEGVSTRARLMPLHDDLVVGNLYHKHFNVCPRQSDLGNDLSCDVFMYDNVELWENNISPFAFEAILYPTVNQWVYQYEGTGFNPLTSTVGQQSDSADDGLSYSCNTENGINNQQAVCTYHKNNLPGSNNDLTFFNLETPVLSLGDLAVGESKTVDVEFSVNQNAECGSPLGIKLDAVVHKNGFAEINENVLETTLGNNGSCSVVNSCSPTSANTIEPTSGHWLNPSRSGNGYDMYKFATPVDRMFYVQYTGKEDGYPVWYITGGNYEMFNNQATNDLLHVKYAGGFSNGQQIIETVGQSSTSYIDDNNAVMTRIINGKYSAEIIQMYGFGGTPDEQHTGHWYNPADSGWGLSIGTQGTNEVILSYLYDNSGQPYWMIGAGDIVPVNDIGLLYVRSFCPHCPKIQTNFSEQGTIRINYDAAPTPPNKPTGTIESMIIDIDNSANPSQWNRANAPIRMITPPVDQ